VHFEIPKWLSLGLIAVIFGIAYWYARRLGPKPPEQTDDATTALLKDQPPR
jgi:hypothetical protein